MNAPHVANYVYTTLSSAHNEFRLLRLDSLEDTEDPIRCEMRPFDLDRVCYDDEMHDLNCIPEHDERLLSSSFFSGEHKAHMEISMQLMQAVRGDDIPYGFLALSYTWGLGPPSDVIIINGKEHRVRNNVHSFLRKMRKWPRRDWIFIDAICINQDDMLERGSQVQLMGRIYRRAREVIAWVSHSGLEEDCHTFNDTFSDTIEITHNVLSSHSQAARSTTGEDDEWNRLAATVQRTATVLYQICDAPYWTRIWVTQELLLARSLVVFVGGTRISMHLMMQALRTIYEMAQAGNLIEKENGDLDDIVRRKTFYAADQRFSVHQLWRLLRYKQVNVASTSSTAESVKPMSMRLAITTFGHHQCTVLYDKIFGLLGLTNSNMKVDYDMPKSELFTKALAECLLTIDHDVLGTNELAHEALMDTCQVLDALAEALQLDLMDECFMLVSHQVISCIGGVFNPCESQGALHLLLKVLWEYKVTGINKIRDETFLDRVGIILPFQYRYARRRMALFWHWLVGRPLLFSDTNETAHTYVEWTQIVQKLVENVKSTYEERPVVYQTLEPAQSVEDVFTQIEHRLPKEQVVQLRAACERALQPYGDA